MISQNNCLNKNKDWNIGSIVNIGFMRGLKIIAINSEKDRLPDIYTLESANGKRYEFIPHNGLFAI